MKFMYPIDNWEQLKRGYKFGVKTFYNSFHIGVDLLVREGTLVFAPLDGRVSTSYGPQGGNTATLTTYSGDKIRFLHLSKFGKIGSVKAGQLIGYSGGRPGAQGAGLSTAEHIHIDAYVGGKYVDPEVYLKPKKPMDINIATVGMSEGTFMQFKQSVSALSNGTINLVRTEYDYALPETVNQDTGYSIANTLDVPEKFLFLCLKSSFTWQMSYYYPKLNQCISVMTLVGTPSMYAFEFKHQLFLWYMTNRGSLPALENMDWNAPTDDMIRAEFKRITPYLELFTGLRTTEQPMQKELAGRIIAKLYKTWLQSDPDGLAYWSGIVDSPEKLENFIDQKLADVKKAVNG